MMLHLPRRAAANFRNPPDLQAVPSDAGAGPMTTSDCPQPVMSAPTLGKGARPGGWWWLSGRPGDQHTTFRAVSARPEGKVKDISHLPDNDGGDEGNASDFHLIERYQWVSISLAGGT